MHEASLIQLPLYGTKFHGLYNEVVLLKKWPLSEVYTVRPHLVAMHLFNKTTYNYRGH